MSSSDGYFNHHWRSLQVINPAKKWKLLYKNNSSQDIDHAHGWMDIY